jgi:hypothetical protein
MRERKAERIGDDFGLRRRREVDGVQIQAGDRRSRVVFLNEARGIARSRADIEQSEGLVAGHNAREHPAQDRMSPEAAVDPNQVREIRPRLFRRDMVQQLGLNEALRKHNKW